MYICLINFAICNPTLNLDLTYLTYSLELLRGASDSVFRHRFDRQLSLSSFLATFCFDASLPSVPRLSLTSRALWVQGFLGDVFAPA